MRALVKLKYIGLVNLVLGDKIGQEPIVQEYIQPSYSDQIDIMVELNKKGIDPFKMNKTFAKAGSSVITHRDINNFINKR